jgi:hypothetical protein
MNIIIFPRSLIFSFRRFGETYCGHLQDEGDFYPEDVGSKFSEKMVTIYQAARCQVHEET